MYILQRTWGIEHSKLFLDMLGSEDIVSKGGDVLLWHRIFTAVETSRTIGHRARNLYIS